MGNLDIMTGKATMTSSPSPSAGGTQAPPQNKATWKSRASNVPLYFESKQGPGNLKGWGKTLRRGHMTTIEGVKPKIIFHFMFNPNHINMAYDVDESALPTDAFQTTGDAASIEGVPKLVGGVSMSFLLLFNRAAEVASREFNELHPTATMTTRDKSHPNTLGVLHDLGVFERLVGALGAGAIVTKPVDVHFGVGGMYGPGLNFRGFIVGANTEFKIFNHNMIPTHAELSIRMRQIFVLPAEGSEAADALQDAQQAADPLDTTDEWQGVYEEQKRKYGL